MCDTTCNLKLYNTHDPNENKKKRLGNGKRYHAELKNPTFVWGHKTRVYIYYESGNDSSLCDPTAAKLLGTDRSTLLRRDRSCGLQLFYTGLFFLDVVGLGIDYAESDAKLGGLVSRHDQNL